MSEVHAPLTLTRKHLFLGLYSRLIPKPFWGGQGGGAFKNGEVTLYRPNVPELGKAPRFHEHLQGYLAHKKLPPPSRATMGP